MTTGLDNHESIPASAANGASASLPDECDVAIIGAGMSGLAAGIRLAYYDRRVCILERHTTIGGLNSFYRLGPRNYDVGLHAVTNFAPRGARRGPLARLLRQLRITWDELALVPQRTSRIAFPDVSLEFSNDLALLTGEIGEKFPRHVDAFRKLVAELADYDELDFRQDGPTARQVLQERFGDSQLGEMLLCPVLFYGGPREHDLDFASFSVLFRSIFCEGLSRPLAGIRLILKLLVRKYKQLGGELRLRSGVRKIVTQDGRAAMLELDDGRTIRARHVLSSAGWLETMRLCDDMSEPDQRQAGRLSFVESVSILNAQPRQVGCDHTMVFYNDSPQFRWQRPDELVDPQSGVICSPNNFDYETPPEEGQMRVTCLANYDRWQALSEPEYRLEKLRWYDRMLASAVRFVSDFRASVVDVDMFTPTTIRRFTGHINGAVYGAPEKHFDGRTHLDNLYLCGTDQGLVGIIGAITSGIAIANRHVLSGETAAEKPGG